MKPVTKGAEETKEAAKSNPFGKGSQQTKPIEDEIEEDIVQDVEDIHLQEKDEARLSGSGAVSSSAVGIDKSIDTLNLEEYDYVEEIKVSPR